LYFSEVDGEVFEAYVKEKEEAKDEYLNAKKQGLGAGLVEVKYGHICN